MTIQFWLNNPMILLNKEYIFELWPSINMSYEQKLNAISRLIILTSILGYLITQNMKILFTGLITLIIIIVVSKTTKSKITKEMLKEGFLGENALLDENNYADNERIINPVTLESVFKEGTKKNPFSNVLLTEILDKPERKSAPPSFNPEVEEKITKNIKRSVQFNNPGIENTNKQLFGDLYENWELDQSNRAFFSTASSQVEPGDQSSLGKWLYGAMYSAKESTPEGNMQREKDSYRYTLY
jgi:hypothetical protein